MNRKEKLNKKEQTDLEQEKLHVKLKPLQRMVHIEPKQIVLSTDETVMVVMDFAIIDVYHHSFQILHVIYYAKDFGERKFEFQAF